ncbi:unnamed protein product [Arctogadus glacialis]
MEMNRCMMDAVEKYTGMRVAMDAASAVKFLNQNQWAPPPPPPPISVLVQLLPRLDPLLCLFLHTLSVRREPAAGKTRVHSHAGQVTGWEGGLWECVSVCELSSSAVQCEDAPPPYSSGVG